VHLAQDDDDFIVVFPNFILTVAIVSFVSSPTIYSPCGQGSSIVSKQHCLY